MQQAPDWRLGCLQCFAGVGLGVVLVLDDGVDTLQPRVSGDRANHEGHEGGDEDELHRVYYYGADLCITGVVVVCI